MNEQTSSRNEATGGMLGRLKQWFRPTEPQLDIRVHSSNDITPAQDLPIRVLSTRDLEPAQNLNIRVRSVDTNLPQPTEQDLATTTISVETRKGPCDVVLGPWEKIREGEIPTTPHLVTAKKLALQDSHFKDLNTYEDLSLLICHGMRGRADVQGKAIKTMLQTVNGHPVYDIVAALREQGYQVDVVVACDEDQSTQEVQVHDLKSFKDEPVLHIFGATAFVGVGWEKDGWLFNLRPGEGGSAIYEDFDRARKLRLGARVAFAGRI